MQGSPPIVFISFSFSITYFTLAVLLIALEEQVKVVFTGLTKACEAVGVF